MGYLTEEERAGHRRELARIARRAAFRQSGGYEERDTDEEYVRFAVSWREAMLCDVVECFDCWTPMMLIALSSSEDGRVVLKTWRCTRCRKVAQGQYRTYVIEELPG